MILRWRDATTLPVLVEGLVPDPFAGLDALAAARWPARVGNAVGQIGDLFEVVADGDDGLTIEGDLRHVRGIGRGMASGRLTVRGTAGPYLGAGMSGGSIDVLGDAGDWAGAEMSGGLLRIQGNAARGLGGAFPGSAAGMREGLIVVFGSAGDEVGARMRRGTIAVAGSVGEGLGRGMIAGTLVVGRDAGWYPGSGMKRGTIALLGPTRPELLPSFAGTGAYRFPFLAVYFDRLRSLGLDVGPEVSTGIFDRYNGDLAEHGKGEILVPESAGG